MYQKEFLIESLDSFIESTKFKLTVEELEFLHTIRDNIAQSKNDEETEKWFLDLISWLMLIKEFLENMT